ncbi:EpsG family protein [Vibrio sp. S9_S30]|uniref:EpsG family protein n=1 Tax=Vibrio sp. S9_S30 TaxID=2720226 RepID=UPI001680126D|nr:EpsG family protein [Vibrio sp. S9_S30]MBD1558466.1 EpsG family protein [Vibrio sp. S9_S30]
MAIYIFLATFFGLLAIFNVRSDLLSFFAFLILFFISGSRFFVGSDYKNYYNVYIDFPKDSFPEPFFNYLIVIFKWIGFGPQSLFLFISFLTILFVFLAIRNAGVSIWLALFLFVSTRGYFDSFNIVRQYLVVVIMLYAIKYLADKRNLTFFVVTVVCIFIHMSAFFYFLFFLFLSRTYSTTFWFLAVLLSTLSIKFNFIPFHLIPSFYQAYVGTSHFQASEFSGIGLGFIMFNLIALSVAFYYSKLSMNKKMVPYLNMYLVGAVVQNLSFQAIIFRRLSVALLVAQIIVIPYMVSRVKRPEHVFWVRCFVVILFLMLFFRGIQVDFNYLEYESMFFSLFASAL